MKKQNKKNYFLTNSVGFLSPFYCYDFPYFSTWLTLNRRYFSSERQKINLEVKLNKKKNTKPWLHNVKSIYFEIEDFNFENFLKEIKSRFILNNSYSILVKVRLTNIEGASIFCMLDEQFGIYYIDSKKLDQSLREKFDALYDRLNFYMSKYSAEEVTLIQVLYIVNNSYEKLRLKNINKLSLDKNIINVKQTKLNFSDKFLPLSTNEIYYGRLINFNTDFSGNYVSSLLIQEIDFIEKLKKIHEEQKKSFVAFSSKTRFYHYIINLKEYIITVKDLDSNKSIKDVYNIHGFKVLSNVIDEKLSENSFIREINNSKFHFENGIVKKKILPIKLPILKSKPSKYKGMVNLNIGSFDIETYRDYDGRSKVYALGFTTLDHNKPLLYYLGQDGNTSNELILNCIDKMLSVKYKDHIYYTHNLGGYDIVFILSALRQFNSDKGFEYYIIDTKLRDSKVLKCTIKVKTGSSYSKITLLDSYNLLPDSLEKLSLSFGSKVSKGLFPYSFITNDTLNYVGNTPSIDYYKVKNKNISNDDYNSLYKKDWCVKTETIKYLERDLLSLLEIMDTFNRYLFIEYNIQMTECLTISRLALNIFIKHYLGKTLLPVINNVSVFSFIKKAYFGGIVEVYKPYGKNLLYYDVNSLYPFVAKNLMPGHQCEYIESENELSLSELFGFYYCKVKTNDNYLGLLPVQKNGLILPNGEWYGVYFSEELKFANEQGYEIKVYKGYTFNKVDNVFNKYVDDLYSKKANTKGSERLINKYLLNSLLGRFGLSILKLITEMLSMDKYAEILSTKPLNSAIAISEQDMLVSYKNEISKKITTEHGLDYISILNANNSNNMEKTNSFDDVAISISAAVTSYARIYISKIKLEILKKGGQIYYSDTDSIVTNIKLGDDLVGKELGQFKLEYKIKEAYFISSKTYCLVLEDEYVTKDNKGIIIKSKGVFDNSLKLNDFKDMYLNSKNVKAIKSNTKTNYQEGYVNIDTKEVTLKYDAYTKRIKVYDDNNKWIDTKPLDINTCYKGFIFYNTCSTDFIWYNTCSTDFVMWDFIMYNTILPIVIPSFILIELDLVIWFPIKPIESSELQVNILIAPLSLIIWNKSKTYIIIYQSKGIWTKNKLVNISKLLKDVNSAIHSVYRLDCRTIKIMLDILVKICNKIEKNMDRMNEGCKNKRTKLKVLSKKGDFTKISVKPHYLNSATQIRSYSNSTDKSLIKPLQFTLDDLTLNITKKEKKSINKIIDSVKDTELFKIAFTHKSCCSNNSVHKSCCSNNSVQKSYETLEFYGDSLLNNYTAKFLYTVYPNYNEGDMTKIRSLLVNTKNLGELSKQIGLNKYLIVNKTLSEKDQKNILNRDKIFADIFESFIAMLFLVKGEDILLNFLELTIFNYSKIKDKREEFKKLNKKINTDLTMNIPLGSSNGKQCEGDSNVEKAHNLNTNKELFGSYESKLENSKDMVIPLDIKSMNQITFKFDDFKTNENLSTIVPTLESLLNKNHLIINKELLKLQNTHDRIIDLNSNIHNDLKININNELTRSRDLHTFQTNELKNIALNQANMVEQIENINKSIIKLEKLEVKFLEQNKFFTNRQFKLNVILAILGLILILFELYKSSIIF